MREWYRDIVLLFALIASAIQAYFAWRGPSAADPPTMQTAAEHPIGGLVLVAALFIVAGVLNSAPLLRRLLPSKKESDTTESDDPDFRKLFLSEQDSRNKYQEQLTLARLEIEQLKKDVDTQKSAAGSATTFANSLREQLQEASKPKSDPLCEALKRIAADDANKLNDRVRQFSQRIEFHGRALEPYLEIITELWNGSVFDLVCLAEISGHAIYVQNQLAIDPRIVYPATVPFNLEHGGRIVFTVRQYLSTEIAKTMEDGRDRGIVIDLSNVMIRFEIFPLPGMTGQIFKWFGPRFTLQDTQNAL